VSVPPSGGSLEIGNEPCWWHPPQARRS